MASNRQLSFEHEASLIVGGTRPDGSDSIRLDDKILLCCSETSLNSWWVKDEIRKAQERERRDVRDIIIPLMVDRYLLHGSDDGTTPRIELKDAFALARAAPCFTEPSTTIGHTLAEHSWSLLLP